VRSGTNFVEESGAKECDGCRLPYLDFQTDFVTHSGDRLCRWCRAVFLTAAVLFERGIEQEDVVIPTLAFAKFAAGVPEYGDLVGMGGVGERPTQADLAKILLKAGMISPGGMERGYLGWDFVEAVEGVPLIRVLPYVVFAEEHAGTQVLKQIRIQVLSKFAEPQGVRGRYEQILTERGVRWDDSASGCVSHNSWGGYLDIRIRPTDELIYKGAVIDRALIEQHKDFFLREAYPQSFPSERPDDHPYPYPSPRYIEASYTGLLGLLRSKKPVGIAHVLDLYGKPIKKTADKVIPAIVAWHLGAHVAPARTRPEIARTLNKHLLGPCEKKTLPEDRWRNDDTVWQDARELAGRLERLRVSAYNNPLNKLPPPKPI
jgi:hypothetical protein